MTDYAHLILECVERLELGEETPEDREQIAAFVRSQHALTEKASIKQQVHQYMDDMPQSELPAALKETIFNVGREMGSSLDVLYETTAAWILCGDGAEMSYEQVIECLKANKDKWQ